MERHYGLVDNKNARIFYRGKSELTGDPIVGVLTGLRFTSANTKTGDMLQAYILVDGMTPTEAIATGADRAICGDCRLRGDGVHGRGCYVTYWQGPLNIHRSLGMRKQMDPWHLADWAVGRWVRLGAYGDPTAIPMTVWAPLLSRASGWVGYTQQWRTCDPSFKFYLMASCLNAQDYEDARAAGWRTYRVRRPDERLLPGEVICPASDEAEHKAQCTECGLCQGNNARSSGRSNAAIVAHGKPGNLKVWGLRMGGLVGRPPAESRPPAPVMQLPHENMQPRPRSSQAMGIDDALALARQPLPSISTIRWWGRT